MIIEDNINNIISFFNIETNSSYRASAKNTRLLIRARLKEGFTVKDFKEVICFKNKQWKDDTKMKEYIRPQTLFGTKFESYLNASRGGYNNSRFLKTLKEMEESRDKLKNIFNGGNS